MRGCKVEAINNSADASCSTCGGIVGNIVLNVDSSLLPGRIRFQRISSHN